MPMSGFGEMTFDGADSYTGTVKFDTQDMTVLAKLSGKNGDAREAVSSAKTVCFLGFGFDAEKIKRLELNRRCQGQVIGASRYHVAETGWLTYKVLLQVN
jgi:hypothetical protein